MRWVGEIELKLTKIDEKQFVYNWFYLSQPGTVFTKLSQQFFPVNVFMSIIFIFEHNNTSMTEYLDNRTKQCSVITNISIIERLVIEVTKMFGYRGNLSR